MKKILIAMGLIPVLTFTGLAQKTEEQRQFDEVSRELSFGIHNIEKSVDTYVEKKDAEDSKLESIMKNNTEIVIELQDAKTDYNVRKTDENFDKLQAVERTFGKSNDEMLANLTDSILIDIEYVNQLSQDYFVLATRYTKFQTLYSSINQSSDSASLEAEIQKMQAQVKSSAGLVIGLIDELAVSTDEKDKLESTLTMLQNEFTNNEIQNTEGISVDNEFDKQAIILKDAAAQMANYARVLEIDKKKIALEALKKYQASIADKFVGGNIVGVGIDPMEKVRELRAKREATLSQYRRNNELATPTKKTPSGKVDHSKIRSQFQ